MSTRKRSRSRSTGEVTQRHSAHSSSHSTHSTSHTAHSSHSHSTSAYTHTQMLDEFGRDVALREKDREREKRRDRDRKSSKGSRSDKERRRSRSKDKRENGDKKRSQTRSHSQDRKRRRVEGSNDSKEHKEGRDTREAKDIKEPKESGEIRDEKPINSSKTSVTNSLPQETEELKKDDEYDPSAPSDFGADYDPEDMLSEMAMMKMFGLPVLFDTSKGKLVEGNNQGTVKLKSQRLYRQYMNRKGGFNRKLDPDKNVGRDTKKKKTPAKPGGPVKPTKGGVPKGGGANTTMASTGKAGPKR